MNCPKLSLVAMAATLAIFSGVAAAGPVNTTATFQGIGTQAWTIGTNWSSTPNHPSGVGAGAVFNNAVANRTVNVTFTVGEAPVTVGSITFNNSSAFSNTINGGTSDITPSHLTFDAVGPGPATVTVTGNSTGSAAPNTISARTFFEDAVVASVDPNSNTSTAGDLAWTGQVINSPGGFTKTGAGMLSLTNNAKLYTGPTLFDANSGRTRISLSGAPTTTSSVTVKDGAQIELISTGSAYTLGSGPLNLNGTGLGVGSTPGNFPGAIRNETSVVAEITNDVVLQSDTLIHVQGVAGITTLSGDVSGIGRLDVTALNSDFNLGKLVLLGTNVYEGGSVVNGGALVAGGASTTAFGTGNVTVQSFAAGASAKIILEAGATNAINDLATLTLAGGNAANTADDGFADLGAGVNETVGSLILGGIAQAPGIYGRVGNPLVPDANESNEYFSGDGIITVAAAEDADFDGDGDVDGADFLTWQRGVGGAGGTNLEHGNANGDGFVDGDDLAIWEEQFGTVTAAANAVPEPSAALLALLAAPLALLARRKR